MLLHDHTTSFILRIILKNRCLAKFNFDKFDINFKIDKSKNIYSFQNKIINALHVNYILHTHKK